MRPGSNFSSVFNLNGNQLDYHIDDRSTVLLQTYVTLNLQRTKEQSKKQIEVPKYKSNNDLKLD